MVLGMSVSAFTTLHVIISLVAIGSGIIVALAMLGSLRLEALTATFLVTTLLTSVTGFFFPFHGVTPGIILGIVSIAVLLPVIFGRYTFHMAGHWRAVYVVGAIVALYLNVLVLITQSFQKVPALHALAPAGNEPPILIAQVLNLVVFAVIGTLGVRRFHPVRVALA